jgi:uncharacterized protein YcfJ
MTPFRLSLISLALATAAGGANAQVYYDDRGYPDDGYYEDARYGEDGYRYDERYGDDRYAQDRYYAEPSVSYPASRNGQYGRTPPAYDLARVTQVSPIVERGRPVQVRECAAAPSNSYANQSRGYGYQERAPYGTRTSGTGAVIGAIAGGVLGNSVGDGDGRKAATVLGAVLGGAIGNGIERNNQYRQAYPSQQVAYRGDAYGERCRVVTRQDGDARVVGYRVNYEYAGRQYETVTDHHPGSELRVRVDVSPAG